MNNKRIVMESIGFSEKKDGLGYSAGRCSLIKPCAGYLHKAVVRYGVKTVLMLILLLYASHSYSQTNATDALFEKYSGKEGFSSVYISSRMLGLFSPREEGKELINRLSSIRILTVENDGAMKGMDLYSELSRNTDLSVYEELMVVKEAGQTTKFLILPKGERIAELLVISGGKDDNSLISIKGDFDLKALSGLSESTGISGLEQLDSLENR